MHHEEKPISIQKANEPELIALYSSVAEWMSYAKIDPSGNMRIQLQGLTAEARRTMPSERQIDIYVQSLIAQRIGARS